MLKLLLKHKLTPKLQTNVELLSDLVYYARTTLCNRQTIGQECYYLCLFDSSTKQLPSHLKRCLVILIKICLPYLLQRTIRGSYQKQLTIIKLLITYLIKINFILFFFGQSTYYNIEERLTSLKLASLRNSTNENTAKMSYALGASQIILLLGQIASDYIRLNKQWATIELTNSMSSSVLPTTSKPHAKIKCSLCLDYMIDATTTPCGHLFCWICIHRHIQLSVKDEQTHVSCPTCRLRIEQNKLIYIFNY